MWKFLEKRPFFQADMAGLGKYCMGGYGRIGVYRVKPFVLVSFPYCGHQKCNSFTNKINIYLMDYICVRHVSNIYIYRQAPSAGSSSPLDLSLVVGSQRIPPPPPPPPLYSTFSINNDRNMMCTISVFI